MLLFVKGTLFFIKVKIPNFVLSKSNKYSMQLEENEVILLKVSGDKPGVTAGLSSILANYDAIILDIGQADIHDTLSLEFCSKSKGSTSGPVLKDLLFKAYELGVKVKFSPVSISDYEIWGTTQTTLFDQCVRETLTAVQLAVTQILSNQNLNIDFIKRLTGRVSIIEKKNRSCIQLSVTEPS
jgi:phosphoserine phosphatase